MMFAFEDEPTLFEKIIIAVTASLVGLLVIGGAVYFIWKLVK